MKGSALLLIGSDSGTLLKPSPELFRSGWIGDIPVALLRVGSGWKFRYARPATRFFSSDDFVMFYPPEP